MTKSTSDMQAVLDELTSNGGNITSSMRACGCDPSLFWQWCERCSADQQNKVEHSRFHFVWGGAARWFTEHYQVSRKRTVALMEGNLRSIITSGRVERQIIFDGEVQFKTKDMFYKWSDDEMIALGYHPSERYERDELNRLIPATFSEPAPAHLLIRGAGAYLDIWRDHRTLDVNTSGSLGVTVIDSRKPVQKAIAPAVAAAVVQEAIEDVVQEDADQLELAAADEQIADTAVTLNARLQRPDIVELQRLCDERNARSNARASAPIGPRYQTLAERGDPRVTARHVTPDDRDEGIGSGRVLPGGARVA